MGWVGRNLKTERGECQRGGNDQIPRGLPILRSRPDDRFTFEGEAQFVGALNRRGRESADAWASPPHPQYESGQLRWLESCVGGGTSSFSRRAGRFLPQRPLPPWRGTPPIAVGD